MVAFFLDWVQAHTRRPWWWWAVAVMACAVALAPGKLDPLFAVGLVGALAVTARRARQSTTSRQQAQARQTCEGSPGYVPPPGRVYDPGALLSAVVAVLAAEGIPTDAGPALGACVQLLTAQGVEARAGAPAPTAWAVTTTLAPAYAPRVGRAVPVDMVTTCIFLILGTDSVLPVPFDDSQADVLQAGCGRILKALDITPDSQTGPPGMWPVMDAIIAAGAGDGAR
jgi:hypothetical protein